MIHNEKRRPFGAAFQPNVARFSQPASIVLVGPKYQPVWVGGQQIALNIQKAGQVSQLLADRGEGDDRGVAVELNAPQNAQRIGRPLQQGNLHHRQWRHGLAQFLHHQTSHVVTLVDGQRPGAARQPQQRGQPMQAGGTRFEHLDWAESG